jgi:hypothetical protein
MFTPIFSPSTRTVGSVSSDGVTDNEAPRYAYALGRLTMAASSLEVAAAEYVACLADYVSKVDPEHAGLEYRDAVAKYRGQTGMPLVIALRELGRRKLADHLESLVLDRNHLIHGELWHLPQIEGAEIKHYERPRKGEPGKEIRSVWFPGDIQELADACDSLSKLLITAVVRYQSGSFPDSFRLTDVQRGLHQSPRRRTQPLSKEDTVISPVGELAYQKIERLKTTQRPKP